MLIDFIIKMIQKIIILLLFPFALIAQTIEPNILLVKAEKGTDLETIFNATSVKGLLEFDDPILQALASGEGRRVSNEERELRKWYIVEVDSTQRETLILTQAAGILQIENSYVSEPTYTPNDPLWSQQLHHYNPTKNDLNIVPAWDLIYTLTGSIGDTSIRWASMDVGCKTDHEDLNVRHALSYDFYSNPPGSTITPDFHGTATAGHMSAVHNEIGVAGIANIPIITYRTVPSQNHAQALWYATLSGVAILNISLYVSCTPIWEAVQMFQNEGGGDHLNGGLIVVSAGNENNESVNMDCPFDLNDKAIVRVAAVDEYNEKTYYSQYGTSIDISATTTLVNNVTTHCHTDCTEDWYATMSGTSSSAPFVSGIAGLVLSVLPKGEFTAEELKQILIHSANPDIYDVAENAPYIGKLGSGRVDAYAALLLTQKPDPVANFIANKRKVPLNENVYFLSTSTNDPITYDWAISPNTYTIVSGALDESSVIIEFIGEGLYDVSLAVFNGGGRDEIVKTNYIYVGEETYESYNNTLFLSPKR